MSQRICSVEDCDRPHRRYGFCGLHSQRFVKYGSPDLPVVQQLTCRGPECVRTVDPVQSRSGLCRSHYKQQHLGKPLKPLLTATKNLGRPEVCIVPECGRPHKARGYCKAHAALTDAGKELRPLQERRPPGECSVEGCSRTRLANDYCAKHNNNRRARWFKYGLTPESGAVLYERQGRACGSCGDPAPIESLHIDHDHTCCLRGSCGDCVRGLICQPCNIAIGYMKDEPARLLAAADYLTRHMT